MNNSDSIPLRELESNGLKNDPPAWHIDSGFPTFAFDGCLTLRGWCFDVCDPVRAVRLVLTDVMKWTGQYGLPRPDVPAAIPRCPTPNCGFEISLKLPVGRYSARLEMEHTSGNVEVLAKSKIHVSRRKRLGYLLWGDAERMLRFQLLAGPSHPPRPIGNLALRSPRGRMAGDQYPSFSIVTPSFNQAPYLEEAIRSVLDQKDVRIQYVVQDGGSTDGSIEILQRAAEALGKSQATGIACSSRSPNDCENLNFEWESNKDQGQADAIRKGFAKTKGSDEDIMAWLNSDDFYLPRALKFVASFFALNPTVDVVYGDRIIVDVKSQEIGRWYLPAHNPKVLQLNDFVPQESLFWRRKVWKSAGGIDPSFSFAMDWDLLIRFAQSGAKIVHLSRNLACFRIHEAQKTSSQIHSIGRDEIERIRAMANRKHLTPEELISNREIRRYLRCSALKELVLSPF